MIQSTELIVAFSKGFSNKEEYKILKHYNRYNCALLYIIQALKVCDSNHK